MTKDIVVVGASAGGIEAFRMLVAGLPAELPASIFVVLHTSPQAPGMLAEILDNVGGLSARSAKDRERIRRGTIYVAPPDRPLTRSSARPRRLMAPGLSALS